MSNTIQIYELGLQALVADRYNDALNYFNQVRQHQPNFPFIERNINQCQRLGLAFNAYVNGIYIQNDIAIGLMNQGRWQEALFQLDYIEGNLQTDFKDCRELMQECRNRYWFDFLCKQMYVNNLESQILELPEDRRQLNDQIPILIEHYKHFSGLESSLIQPQPSVILEDPQNYFNEIQNIDKVKIYYNFTKPSMKCVIQKPNLGPFKHSECRTTAYFSPNGTISCDGNCEQYLIYDAHFSCQLQEVKKKAGQDGDFESITASPVIADFVQNCLQKNNLSQNQQRIFRANLSLQLMPVITRRGLS